MLILCEKEKIIFNENVSMQYKPTIHYLIIESSNLEGKIELLQNFRLVIFFCNLLQYKQIFKSFEYCMI